MWFLVGQDELRGNIWPLMPGKTLTVGRRGMDVAFLADKTISRTHLTITIRNNGVWDTTKPGMPQSPQVVITDENSTSGTMLNGTALVRGTQVALSQINNIVQIGRTGSELNIVYLPICITLHKLATEERNTLEDHAQKTGIKLLELWIPKVSTHLCMTALEVKGRKLFECLTAARPVVATQWIAKVWKNFCTIEKGKAVVTVTQDDTPIDCARRWLPAEDRYLPPITASIHANFHPNVQRQHIFDDLIIVLFNEQFDRMSSIISSGGGIAEAVNININMCSTADITTILNTISQRHSAPNTTMVVLTDNIQHASSIMHAIQERSYACVIEQDLANVILSGDIAWKHTLTPISPVSQSIATATEAEYNKMNNNSTQVKRVKSRMMIATPSVTTITKEPTQTTNKPSTSTLFAVQKPRTLQTSSAALDFLDEILDTPLELGSSQSAYSSETQLPKQSIQRQVQTKTVISQLGRVGSLRDVGLPMITTSQHSAPSSATETEGSTSVNRVSALNTKEIELIPSNEQVTSSQPVINAHQRRNLVKRLAEQVIRAEQSNAPMLGAAAKERAVTTLDDDDEGTGRTHTTHQELVDYEALHIQPQDLGSLMRVEYADLVVTEPGFKHTPTTQTPVQTSTARVMNTSNKYACFWPTQPKEPSCNVVDFKRFRKSRVRAQLPIIIGMEVYNRNSRRSHSPSMSDDNEDDMGNSGSLFRRTEATSQITRNYSRKRRVLETFSTEAIGLNETSDNGDDYNDREFQQTKVGVLRAAPARDIAQLTTTRNMSSTTIPSDDAFTRPIKVNTTTNTLLNRIGRQREQGTRPPRRKLLNDSDIDD